MTITRFAGAAAGRNSGTAYGGLVWAVATADGQPGDIAEQTRLSLAKLDRILQGLGSDRSHILSATVYIADLADKAAMDAVWCDWLGPDRANWPQRACVGVALPKGTLVEIVVVAAPADQAKSTITG